MKTFMIPGIPMGKGRPRFVRQGNDVVTYTPETTASYENLVKLEYQRQCGSEPYGKETMLYLYIEALFPIPKSASKKRQQMMIERKIRPTKKPDVDNIIKIIADSLNHIAYHDDSQIVQVQCDKFYAVNGCVRVTIGEFK